MDTPETTPVRTSNRPAFLGWGVAVLLVLAAWVAAYAMRGGGEKVVMTGWQDGLEAGQAAAEELDRPMVVLFTASWCPPCQVLKNSVLTEPAVHDQLLAGFVPVQVDLTDRSSANPNLETAGRYGVQGIPTVLALDAEGSVLSSYRGGPEAQPFMDWLASIER